MRTTSLIAAAALSLAAPTIAFAQDDPAVAVSEEQMALAREVIDLGFPAETRMDSMVGVADQLIGQMMAGNPALQSDARMRAIIERFRLRVVDLTREVLALHIDDMMDGMAVAYAESFSPEELTALHHFVSTPEGRGLLTRMTEINTHPAFAEANQGYINDYMARVPALQQELMQEIMSAMTKSGAAEVK